MHTYPRTLCEVRRANFARRQSSGPEVMTSERGGKAYMLGLSFPAKFPSTLRRREQSTPAMELLIGSTEASLAPLWVGEVASTRPLFATMLQHADGWPRRRKCSAQRSCCDVAIRRMSGVEGTPIIVPRSSSSPCSRSACTIWGGQYEPPASLTSSPNA